jgi:hypothetical protein
MQAVRDHPEVLRDESHAFMGLMIPEMARQMLACWGTALREQSHAISLGLGRLVGNTDISCSSNLKLRGPSCLKTGLLRWSAA